MNRKQCSVPFWQGIPFARVPQNWTKIRTSTTHPWFRSYRRLMPPYGQRETDAGGELRSARSTATGCRLIALHYRRLPFHDHDPPCLALRRATPRSVCVASCDRLASGIFHKGSPNKIDKKSTPVPRQLLSACALPSRSPIGRRLQLHSARDSVAVHFRQNLKPTSLINCNTYVVDYSSYIYHK